VLHRLTYAVAALGLVHFWWSQKKDVTEPLLWTLGFAALLGWRVWRRLARPATATSSGADRTTPRARDARGAAA
jgi:sulfoxide reductase heme-binding subunit YedZ